MDEDFNAIFDGRDPDETGEVTEATTDTEVTETPEVEAAPAEQPEATQPAQAEAPKEPAERNVPLGALLEEREKRKEREKELEDLRKQLAPRPAQVAPQTPSHAPDPIDDPQGYHAFVIEDARRMAAQEAFNTRVAISESLAAEKHGEEVVKAAQEWAMERAQRDPAFAQEAVSQKHPVEWAVQQHKTHTFLSEVQSDPDAYVLRRAAELGMIKPEEIAQAIPSTTITEAARKAPKSLASVTSQGKATPHNPGDDFDALFGR